MLGAVNKSGKTAAGRSLSARASKKSTVSGQRCGFLTALRFLGVLALRSM